MTLLPLVSVRTLSRWRFLLMRSVLFPGCRLGFEELLRRGVELDQEMRKLGNGRRVRMVEHRATWYGFDPIHIRRRQRHAAWHEILADGDNGGAPQMFARGSFQRWAYLASRVPHDRRVFGVRQRREQPAGQLVDGTTVSFY
jgi:hypothetical protein